MNFFGKRDYILILLFLCFPAFYPAFKLLEAKPSQEVLGTTTSNNRVFNFQGPNFTCGLPFYRDVGCPCKEDRVCKSNLCNENRCVENSNNNDERGLRCDFNADGISNVSDYNILISELDSGEQTLQADCNKNGEIDVIDYVLWLQEFLVFNSN